MTGPISKGEAKPASKCPVPVESHGHTCFSSIECDSIVSQTSSSQTQCGARDLLGAGRLGTPCLRVHTCSVTQCPTLHSPWTTVRHAPLSMGILQARILEWVAIPPPGDLPHAGVKPESLRLMHRRGILHPLSHQACTKTPGSWKGSRCSA